MSPSPGSMEAAEQALSEDFPVLAHPMQKPPVSSVGVKSGLKSGENQAGICMGSARGCHHQWPALHAKASPSLSPRQGSAAAQQPAGHNEFTPGSAFSSLWKTQWSKKS